MISSREAYFDVDYVFDGIGKMAFAYGLTEYDDNVEAIEDASIGVLKPYYKTWGLGSDHSTLFTPIAERKCLREELHLNDPFAVPQPGSKFN